MSRSLIPCWKPKYSLNGGDNITTMYVLTAVLGYKPPAPEAVIPSTPKQSYMQIKSNNPNFNSGPNIGGWSKITSLSLSRK